MDINDLISKSSLCVIKFRRFIDQKLSKIFGVLVIQPAFLHFMCDGRFVWGNRYVMPKCNRKATRVGEVDVIPSWFFVQSYGTSKILDCHLQFLSVFKNLQRGSHMRARERLESFGAALASFAL
jgi:hypothetical protein